MIFLQVQWLNEGALSGYSSPGHRHRYSERCRNPDAMEYVYRKNWGSRNNGESKDMGVSFKGWSVFSQSFDGYTSLFPAGWKSRPDSQPACADALLRPDAA